MLETVIIPIAVVVILLGSFLFAKHMDTIRMQAHMDRKYVITKWLVYSRKYNAYHFGEDGVIVCVDEVEEAWKNLMDAANWYNKRYNKYGCCIPPELLIKFKEEDHEASC